MWKKKFDLSLKMINYPQLKLSDPKLLLMKGKLKPPVKATDEYNSYLGTPSGAIKKYDPSNPDKTKRVTTL